MYEGQDLPGKVQAGLYREAMSTAVQALQPADITRRRISFEETHVEVSDLEGELRAALEHSSVHYMELLEEAAAQGYPAPVFEADDGHSYSLHAPVLRHREHFWQRYARTQVLACLRTDIPEHTPSTHLTLHVLACPVSPAHTYCNCDGHYFVKNVSAGCLHAGGIESAGRALLCAFSAQALDMLDAIERSSQAHLLAARRGLLSVESAHVALTA
jgi:hypothetical protein